MRISELKQKEVINICDGCRLGFICDMEIDAKCGKIKKIIIPAKGKFFGIFGCEQEYHINWCDIKCIGNDLILIEADMNDILIDI